MQDNLKKTDETDDPKLLKRASLRAGFKVHLAIFILVNLLFWVIWFFVFRGNDEITEKKTMNAVLFLSIAWFIVILGHFLVAYKWNRSMVEKELASLQKEMKEKEKELKKIREKQESSDVKK